MTCDKNKNHSDSTIITQLFESLLLSKEYILHALNIQLMKRLFPKLFYEHFIHPRLTQSATHCLYSFFFFNYCIHIYRYVKILTTQRYNIPVH